MFHQCRKSKSNKGTTNDDNTRLQKKTNSNGKYPWRKSEAQKKIAKSETKSSENSRNCFDSEACSIFVN